MRPAPVFIGGQGNRAHLSEIRRGCMEEGSSSWREHVVHLESMVALREWLLRNCASVVQKEEKLSPPTLAEEKGETHQSKEKEDGEVPCQLVMPDAMVKTFFTRIRLQLNALESRALEISQRAQREGVGSVGMTESRFESLVATLRKILDHEVDGVKQSHRKTVKLFKEHPEAEDKELDRVVQARNRVELLRETVPPGAFQQGSHTIISKRRDKYSLAV